MTDFLQVQWKTIKKFKQGGDIIVLFAEDNGLEGNSSEIEGPLKTPME